MPAARIEVLAALRSAAADAHAVLDIVLNAAGEADARETLMSRYGMSAAAATAVLNTQLSRLTATGRERVADELAARRAELGG